MDALLALAETQISIAEQPDQNPAAVYLAGLSKGSRPAMRQALDVVAQILTGAEDAGAAAIPWHRLRFQHTQAIRAELAERYAHSTANKTLSALRQTLKMAWQLGQMSAEDYHKAASIDNVKGQTVPAGRAITRDEISALLDTCGQTATDIRDAAIIALLYSCGLRRAELVGLDLADYAEETLKVRGKRNKTRLAPVVNGAADALADWLTVRGQQPGALLWGTGNRNSGGRLTGQAIYKMLATRAEDAGIADLSPHDFRRTFVSDLLDAGADISAVQQLAGHANVQTTIRYDRRGEKAKRKAAGMLHVPYRRRVLETD